LEKDLVMSNYIDNMKEKKGFLNDNMNKKTDKSPSMVGYLKVNGVTYQVSGWKGTNKLGLDMFKLSVNEIPKK
jgi:hypothetical protein